MIHCDHCEAPMPGRRRNARYCTSTCRARAAESRERVQSDAEIFWQGICSLARRRSARRGALV